MSWSDDVEEHCLSFEVRLTVAIEERDTATLRRVLVKLYVANARGCLRAIAKSGLGKTVHKLTKHEDAQVAQAAAAVCVYWRALSSGKAVLAAPALLSNLPPSG